MRNRKETAWKKNRKFGDVKDCRKQKNYPHRFHHKEQVLNH